MIEVRSPYDGSVVGTVQQHRAADVDRAVERAAAALTDNPLPAHQRAEILDTAARLLKDPERQEQFARTIAAEAAKPIKTARTEAARAVSTFTFSAAAARTIASTGHVVPMDAADVGEGKLAFTLRKPIGVVGGISPFNFPLNLVAHKVAPAIAAGCPLVLKPASQTPLSAVNLARLLIDECGLPPEYLHVLPGPASEVGKRIVEHPDIAMITFTGSGEVGWSIREKAPRKKVSLELGNNSPIVIEPDGDWRTAAKKIATAGFSHAGQSCISTQRVYVHAEIADAFLAELVPHVEALKVGDPMDDDTDVSALISHDDAERVLAWIKEAESSGAKVLTGGDHADRPTTIQPTVLANVSPDMKVCKDEVFGPVVAVQSYTDFDDALALADDTRFGLQAAVFTSDINKALAAADRLHFGGVLINEVPTYRADQMPYGGVRSSGNTKEGPAYAVQEMTEERLVIINRA